MVVYSNLYPTSPPNPYFSKLRATVVFRYSNLIRCIEFKVNQKLKESHQITF